MRSKSEGDRTVNMLHQIKHHFRKITPLEIASAELVEAEIAKLEAESGKEFAESQCTYHSARISRLKKYINTLTKEEAK